MEKRTETVLKNISRTQLIGTWVAATVVLMACSVVVGADLGTAALWLAAGAVPPGVALLLWHGPPAATITELLHPVNGESKEGRP